jgi:hypothetical protein
MKFRVNNLLACSYVDFLPVVFLCVDFHAVGGLLEEGWSIMDIGL